MICEVCGPTRRCGLPYVNYSRGSRIADVGLHFTLIKDVFGLSIASFWVAFVSLLGAGDLGGSVLLCFLGRVVVTPGS